MKASIKLYGLPYCDATKAAIKWFNDKGFATLLHNYKTDGIAQNKLLEWCNYFGWQKILNKRSTTWRSLSIDTQNNITDETSAIKIMLANTSLIKRPVIEYGKQLIVGFDEKSLNNIFK